MNNNCLCIDVGKHFIKYAAIDSELNFSDRGSIPTPYDGIDLYMNVLTEIFEPFKDKVSGIALSMPGVIDSRSGICITGGSLPYVELFPLARKLSTRCGVPVSIINDVKSSAVAEVTWGALADCQDAVVIMVGNTIEGALVKDGEIHMGKHFSAGNFSWLMTSGSFNLVQDSWSVHNGDERLIHLASAAKGLPPDSLTISDIFRWAKEGDKNILWVLDKFTKDIASMIINFQSIYDPERFAIGGEISRHPLFLSHIRKNLQYYHTICPFPIPEPEVTACKYFEDAGLIGALGYFLNRYGGEMAIHIA